MKKSNSILIPILSAIFAISLVFAFSFGFGANDNKAYAEGEDITSTAYMISADGDYLLLATAFKLSLLENGEAYAFGYDVSIDGVAQDDTYYSSVYYEGITLKTGDTTKDYAPEQIFGEGYSFANGYALIVEEIPYTPGSQYSYTVYIQKENSDKVQGTAYENMQKYSVTFDTDGGTAIAKQFVKSGAKVVEPTEPTKDGYNFTGWKNGENDFNFASDTITGNVTLTAQWKQRPTLEYNNGDYRYQIDHPSDIGYRVTLNDYTADELVLKYGDRTLVKYVDNGPFSHYYFNANESLLVLMVQGINNIFEYNKSTYVFNLNGTEFSLDVDNNHNKLLLFNGGFETGDLSGWNSYQIWNNESGMTAWTNDRVVWGTYFDGNYSYNRDGNYNLGIYGGSISKDSGQERMGHLRSSDFTLGGSGWVSFKLGGGRDSNFAYASVRKPSDNVEVARFGNKNYNDTSLSGTSNAEAFMFQYYYNLSAYLGQELYFVISDSSSNHWCVLSADSFVTYYEQAPETTEATLATNILPAVIGVGSSTNAIVNGTFEKDNFDSTWTISGDGWGRTSNQAKSNMTNGDGGVGILRSSAFNINGDNKYLRFQFGGTRYWDKTIFLSVKEVGTNIEVKRFTLRQNLRGGKGSGTENYDNHMCDIHDLDTNKEYYLEFCDNETGSWGVFWIKEVTLCNQSKWDEKPASDRATVISGIVTDYTFHYTYWR